MFKNFYTCLFLGFCFSVFAQEDKISKGNNKFAVELLQQTYDSSQNLIFSPYSLSSALAMVYAGAKSNTEQQIKRVLHLKKLIK